MGCKPRQHCCWHPCLGWRPAAWNCALAACGAVLLASCTMIQSEGAKEELLVRTPSSEAAKTQKNPKVGLQIDSNDKSPAVSVDLELGTGPKADVVAGGAKADNASSSHSVSSSQKDPSVEPRATSGENADGSGGRSTLRQRLSSSLRILSESRPAAKPGGTVITASAALPADSNSREASSAAPASAAESGGPLLLEKPGSALPLTTTPSSALETAGALAMQGSITLAGVLEHTLKHHPTLRIRQHEIEEIQGQLIGARLLPNPQFVLNTDAPAHTNDPPGITARLEFEIPTGPKRRLQTAAAEAAVRKTKMTLRRETRVVLAEALDAAMEVLYLQELVALNQNLGQLAAQAAEFQRERFKLAAVPYRNVVQAELATNKIELDRRNATAQLELARVRLARAMGLSSGVPPALQGQLNVEPLLPMSLDAVLARTRQVAPDLAEAQAAIEESRQQHSLEKWNAVPNPSVGPRFSTALANEAEPGLGGRFQIDLPVFDRNQGAIAESAAVIRTRRAELALAEVTALNDVAAAYLELKDIQSQWEYYSTKIAPLMVQTEAAVRDAFEDRTVGAFEVADMLQQAAKMRMSDLEIRYQHQRLRTRLELLLECPLSGPTAKSSVPAPELVPTPVKTPLS